MQEEVGENLYPADFARLCPDVLAGSWFTETDVHEFSPHQPLPASLLRSVRNLSV
jgi:hypothetical protein